MSSDEQEQSPSSPSIEQWIEAARDESRERLGQVLEVCRQYLLLVANEELDAELRGKVGASDVVQETFLEAQRDFADFNGHSQKKLLAWLRRIVLNNLTNVARHYRQVGKRSVGREVAAGDSTLDKLLRDAPAEPQTPSRYAMTEERDRALHEATEQLPEPGRQVIQWRNYERCSFEEIGRRLGRSPEAARKISSRALEQLGEMLDPPSDLG